MGAVDYNDGIPAQYLHAARPYHLLKSLLYRFIGDWMALILQRFQCGHGGSGVFQLESAQKGHPQLVGLVAACHRQFLAVDRRKTQRPGYIFAHQDRGGR